VDLVFVEHPGAIRAGLQSGRTSVRLTLGDEVNADDRRTMSVRNEEADPGFISFGKLCVSGEFERRYPAIVQRVVTTLVRLAAWASDEKNATQVIQSWATSPDELKRLGRIYGGKAGVREQMSPLMDQYFQLGLRRDSDDAKRFEIIKAESNTGFAGWLEPKYLTRALQDLKLENYWPERTPEGAPRTRPE
jgi:sulfonate transport system substrate-binding protein